MKKLLLVLLLLALVFPALAEDCLCTQMEIPIEDCTPDSGVPPTESSSGRNPNYFCPYCGRLLYPGAEIPPLASNQQAVSEPEPEPEPAPAPEPEPEPDPAPQPQPQPEPEPAPAPAPVQEEAVIPASQPEPAAPAVQEAPIIPASEPEPAASSMSLPPVPAVQEPPPSDQSYVEEKPQEEAAAAPEPAAQSAPGPAANPVFRRKTLSLFFPYRHYLLKPTPAVCPHAGILLWSSTQNNETGGLFASYIN